MPYLISEEPSDAAIVIPSLQMRQLRPREVKKLAQGQAACCWELGLPVVSQRLPSLIV